MTYHELPIPEQIFIAQSNAIRDAADRGACVIIGRCGDYVLGERKNCVKIFIHAPLEWRVKVVRDEYREEEGCGEPSGFVRKLDKDRAAYYNFFTHQKWGRVQNYHLCLDSSIGFDASVRILKNFVEEFSNIDA
jgi:cytidylate kinase